MEVDEGFTPFPVCPTPPLGPTALLGNLWRERTKKGGWSGQHSSLMKSSFKVTEKKEKQISVSLSHDSRVLGQGQGQREGRCRGREGTE